MASTRDCLYFEERSNTPPEIQRFRKASTLAPGKRYQHHALAKDYENLNLEERTFGVKTINGPSDKLGVNDLLSKSGPRSRVERLNEVKGELISKSQPPLENALGYSAKASPDANAKNLIFPALSEDTVQAEEIYKKTHHSYHPGEQKKRDYKWPINPNEARFGAKSEGTAFNGVSAGVSEVLGSAAQNSSKDLHGLIERKAVEDYRDMNDILGRSRNLGQGSSLRPADMFYGKRSAGNEWGAAATMRGKTSVSISFTWIPNGSFAFLYLDYSDNTRSVWTHSSYTHTVTFRHRDWSQQGEYKEVEQRPDPDLGKTLTPGFRNVSIETRAFGCPSVRTDLPKANRATRSIADSQNYGDDYNARDLISPPAFSDLAMAPTAFAEGKSKDYLIQLFQTIGYTFPGEVSQVIFQVASRGHGDLATIKDYRAVLNEYVYACEIGKEQEWLEVNGRAEV